MDFLAEREGFEPPVPLGTTVFKTAAFDHSAISPERDKSRTFFYSAKNFLANFSGNAEKKRVSAFVFLKHISEFS